MVEVGETRPLLSAVVPAAIRHEHIENLLNWLSEAANFDLEVLLVLDESRYGKNLEIQKRLSSLNNLKIKVLSGNYGSPGLSRNRGLENATGKWICFWDCDDYPSISNVFSQLTKIDKTDVDICIGSYEIVNRQSNKKLVKELLGDSIQENLLYIARAPGLWRFCFRREIIENLRFDNSLMGEDQLFLLDTKFWNLNFISSSSIFYKYFSNADLSLTSSKFALRESAETLAKSILIFKNDSSDNLDYVATNICAQFVSGIRHSPIFTKLVLTVIFVKSFFVLGIKKNQAILNAVSYLVKVNFHK